MRRRATLLLAVLLALPVAACGGDDDGDDAARITTTSTTSTTTGAPEVASGTSASAYAGAVCSSIGAWYERIDTAGMSFVADADEVDGEDPAADKARVLAFLDEVLASTDALLAELEGAGAPGTETGPEAARRLLEGITEVRALFAGAREETAGLPDDDAQALAAGREGIGEALQESALTLYEQLQEALAPADDAELSDAFRSTTACQDLSTVS